MNIYDKNDRIPKPNKGKDKVRDFFRKQGFYVALFACVALIGLAALLAINWDTEDKQEQAKNNDQSVQKIESENLDEAQNNPIESSSPSPSDDNDDSTKTNANVTLKLAIPLEGEIISKSSINSLIYNETLNQWATHNGIDIKGEEGAEVKAAKSGVIESIVENELYGHVITISHGENKELQTVYIGAKPIDGITEGVKVNEGQPIGTLTIPIFEKHLGPHLHFEVISNGDYLDPEKNLNK